MTGQNLVDFINNLIDDTIENDFCLELINAVKDLVESDRPWRMLIKEDSSQTFTASNDYLDSKDLPDDFFEDYKVFLGSESDDSYTEYHPVAFEKRRLWKDSQKYYIDFANKKIYICGSVGSTKTIYQYYIYETDDIALDTSPVWPTKFHKMIGFLVAELHKAGIDADILNLQQAVALSKQGNLLYEAMISWDSMMKLRSMNFATPIVDE